MRKILLVIEDYHERTYLQTMLKKVGWDVIGLSTELGLGEQVLTFRPDTIVVSQMVRRTRGFDIAKSIKKRDGFPKIIVVGTGSPTKEDLEKSHVDLYLISPVNSRLLFEFLEKAGGFSAKASLQKIRNMRHPQEKPHTEEHGRMMKSQADMTEILAPTIDKVVFDDTAERQKKYKDFLAQTPVVKTKRHFKPNEIQTYIGKIVAEGYTEEEIRLDEEKKAFVKALFDASKKKS